MDNQRRINLVSHLADTSPFETPADDMAEAVLNSLGREPIDQVNTLMSILLELGDWLKVARVLHVTSLVAPSETLARLVSSVAGKVKSLHCSEEPPQSANLEKVSGPVNFILGAVLWLLYLGELTAAKNLPCMREIQDALKDICTSLHYDEQCYGRFVADNLERGPVMRKYDAAISKAMNGYVASGKMGEFKDWSRHVAEEAYPVRNAMTYHLSFLLIRRMAYAMVDGMNEVEFLKAVAYAQ